MEDLAGGSPEGSVNVDVERGVHLLDVQLLPLHAARSEGIEVTVRNEQRASDKYCWLKAIQYMFPWSLKRTGLFWVLPTS